MSWWAIYSEPGRALVARDSLARAGLAVFCPVEQLTKRRKIPNRNKYRVETVVTPVYARYLFADAAAPCDVVGTRGVLDVVRFGGNALEVPESVMTVARAGCSWVDEVGDLVGARDTTLRSLRFKGVVGDTVKFKSGPFAGFLGVLSSLASLDVDGNVKTFVDMLGARHEVPVAASEVVRVAAGGKELVAA